MPGQVPRYQGDTIGGLTALSAITGGQVVEGAAGGVQPAGAASNTVIGVAAVDAIPAATSQSPSVPGVASNISVNVSPYPPYCSVIQDGVVIVQYAAAATFGVRLIAAAAGTVTPAAATPDARQVIGICMEPNGVALNGFGQMRLTLS